ncbi:RagB/SusD family nutrient uptake outer membrane protein [Porphyromonas macacae]|uniref:RagB/SusD family nutrient uptake outer membrane protein n=1 Tax=Porphyromonas macacae TaxID=28115 RepID=UPI0024ACC962|nr:RagB/SusD family nutrient uptake outer membrane protein [Porphyromonas macacae]
MKRISYIIAAVFLLAFAFGCKKSFLDTAPTDSLSDETLKQSLKGIEGVLDGIHNMFYMYYFGQRFGDGSGCLNVQLDMLSNSHVNSLTALWMSVYRWTDHRNPNGKINYLTWDYYYTLVQHANTVLKMSAEAKAIAPEDMNRLRGEALIVRAFCFSNLVQLFGKRYVPGGDNSSWGIVLRLEPNIDPMPRSTVAETYAQINKDIKEGLELFAKAKILGKKNRLTMGTAYGIAARIAMAQQDYPLAEKYANEAMKATKAKLQSGDELLNGFNNYEASEWMWGYRQAADQNRHYAGFGAHYSYNFKGGWNESLRYAINRSYYDKMNKTDVRRKWFVALDQGDKIPDDADPGYFLVDKNTGENKWETTGQCIKFAVANDKSSFIDQVLMRLGEMFYIKAEAQARQNNIQGAVATLEEVMKTRDPQYTVSQDMKTADKLAEEILRNKFIDLYFEGQAFYDIKRLGIVPNRLASTNDKYMNEKQKAMFKQRNSGKNVEGLPKDASDKVWEFVIPYKELVGNKLCQQNPL